MKSCHNFCYKFISKTKRNTGLISIEDVQEVACAESNGHVTDDVTRPYDVTVVTQYSNQSMHAYFIAYRLVLIVDGRLCCVLRALH